MVGWGSSSAELWGLRGGLLGWRGWDGAAWAVPLRAGQSPGRTWSFSLPRRRCVGPRVLPYWAEDPCVLPASRGVWGLPEP